MKSKKTVANKEEKLPVPEDVLRKMLNTPPSEKKEKKPTKSGNKK